MGIAFSFDGFKDCTDGFKFCAMTFELALKVRQTDDSGDCGL